MLYSKPRFVPQLASNLYTFEVKTARGINEASVYEAVAHRRYANYSILVWEPTKERAEVERISELCRDFGVGALLATEPQNPRSYEVLVQPQKTQIDVSIVDRFIDVRFPANERIRIEKWLEDQGWMIPPREGPL